MKWKDIAATVGLAAAVQLAAYYTLASFTASPVPWDGTFELQPANSDPVSQGAAHLRQIKGESSRRAGVSLDWGVFGNVTTDLGRVLRGVPRIFAQSAAPAVDGTTGATCLPEADTAGNRHCAGGELWLDTDDNQLYVALDAGADNDADSWQSTAGFGRKTIWIPAGAMVPALGGGASLPSIPGLVQPGGAGTAGFSPLDFDPAAVEAAQFSIFLPKSAATTPFNFQVIWTANAAAVTSVVWALSCVSYADNVVIDDGVSLATVTDAHNGTAHELDQSAEAGFNPVNPVAGQWMQCEVQRRGTDGSDTLAVDARLIGIVVYYTVVKANDN